MYNIRNMIEMFLTGIWSEWTPWGSCDEEDGKQVRTRNCSRGCNDVDALRCVGPDIEEKCCRFCRYIFCITQTKKVQNCILLFYYLEMFKLKFFAI